MPPSNRKLGMVVWRYGWILERQLGYCTDIRVAGKGSTGRRRGTGVSAEEATGMEK